MARSSKDFLNYARQFGTARLSSPTADNSYSNVGDENPGADVWGTDQSSYSATAIASRDDERVFQSDEYSSGTEQDEDGGVSTEGRSGYDSDAGDGYHDYPVRNYHRSTNQPASSIQPSPVKSVIKKRTSLLDDVTRKVKSKLGGNKLPPKTAARIANTTRKLLTIAEVTNNRQGLINLVMWSSDNLDNGITAITRGHKEVQIWSTMEYADAEIIVDAFSDAGQRSEYWANAYRTVLEYQKKVKLGVILLPRAYKSIMYLIMTGIDLRME